MRYKRSFLGIVWAMINPLLTMVVMTIVFLNVFRFDVLNYPIYLLSGILVWRLFSSGTTLAMRSVLSNAPLSKNIYIPASVFVATSIGTALINFLLAVGPLLILAVATGVSPRLSWLSLPLPILQTSFFAFGIGLILAALAVFFADMLDIYDVLVNAYYFLTPVIYPITVLPSALADLEVINPMNHFISAFRGGLLGSSIPDPMQAAGVTLFSLVVMSVGWSIFTRLSDEFAFRA